MRVMLVPHNVAKHPMEMSRQPTAHSKRLSRKKLQIVGNDQVHRDPPRGWIAAIVATSS
jgi:hypothetical protein